MPEPSSFDDYWFPDCTEDERWDFCKWEIEMVAWFAARQVEDQ